jgi:hypothetical protein
MDYIITKYFEWENGPAVVAKNEIENYIVGFFIPYDSVTDDWVVADGAQVYDFYIDGMQLSQGEFEAEFGIIGEDLPDIPMDKV